LYVIEIFDHRNLSLSFRPLLCHGRFGLISCAAYCAPMQHIWWAESIIKEILRIDGSRSCFDFTTVFATLLGWDSSRRRLRVLALPSKPRGIFANLAKSPRDHRPMLAAIKTRTGRSKASPRDESADP
jgi:hypothetical protein